MRRLESRTWGALPLVNAFFDRLGIDAALEDVLPRTDRRQKLSPARAIGLLIRNLLLSRRPLYALSEWAAPLEPALVGMSPPEIPLLNDDRVGRALDRLFDADRPGLVMRIVVQAVRKFDLKLEELHNDSTTVTFQGKYLQADGQAIRGKPTVVVTWGHNKDHRPDLKQLLYQLTVTSDGAVPLHYHVWSGNTADDVTHESTWDVLRELVGHPNFLYVGDCKVCSERILRYIDERGGCVLTVLPRTRKEDQQFREWVRTNEVPWEEIWRRKDVQGQKGRVDVYRAYEWPLPSAEGMRILWIHTTEQEQADQQKRQGKMERARRALEELRCRLAAPKCRLREREAVEREVRAALGDASRWIQVEIRTVEDSKFLQERRGRPGPKTPYRREIRKRYGLEWKANEEVVRLDARSDGTYPLITNDRKRTPKDLLLAYKRQPYPEQRFDGLKNAHEVAPQFLKNIARIEALLCAYFLALLVDALIEREIRRAMKAEKIEKLPLYPEQRKCKQPTAERILEVFGNLQVHRLLRGKETEVYAPELTPLQRKLLRLLGVPTSRYTPIHCGR